LPNNPDCTLTFWAASGVFGQRVATNLQTISRSRIISGMKRAVVIAVSLALTGCKSKPQVQPQKSPECLAAVKKEADDRAHHDLINQEIKGHIENDRLELKNLELEDQIARHEGRPVKNMVAIALLKNKIETDELSLEHDIDSSPSRDAVSQALINLACNPPAPK